MTATRPRGVTGVLLLLALGTQIGAGGSNRLRGVDGDAGDREGSDLRGRRRARLRVPGALARVRRELPRLDAEPLGPGPFEAWGEAAMGVHGAARVLVGTTGGLHEVGASERTHLMGHEVTALAASPDGWWAAAEGRTIWHGDDGGRDGMRWSEVARVGATATCVAWTPAGLVVGTAGAHVFRLIDRALARVESFERAPGRGAWYTPWGDPPDTCSLAADPAGTLYVNVHVGGVTRSPDGGRTWQPTLDIDTDVHQVLAHPEIANLVMVASAEGFGESGDGGQSWTFDATGLHGRYLRAVAAAGDTVLVTASTGPRATRGALYRRQLGATSPWVRCREGLPGWLPGNTDTHCLAARGSVAVVGTDDGRLFVSTDQGQRWALAAKGLPAVRCVALG